MGEVGGSFVLRVFQAHVQPSDADSSVDLVEGERGHKEGQHRAYKAISSFPDICCGNTDLERFNWGRIWFLLVFKCLNNHVSQLFSELSFRLSGSLT